MLAVPTCPRPSGFSPLWEQALTRLHGTAAPVHRGTLGGSGPRNGQQQAGLGRAGGRLAWGPSWRAWPGRTLSQRTDAPRRSGTRTSSRPRCPRLRPPQLSGDLCCCPGWWRPFKCAGVVSRQQGRLHRVTLHPVWVPGPVLAPAPPRPSCPLRGTISLARCSENSISFN